MKRKQTTLTSLIILLSLLLIPLSVSADPEEPTNTTITIHTNKDVDQLVMNSGMGEFLVTPITEYSDEEQKGNNQVMDMNGDLKVNQADFDILKAHVDGSCKDYTATVRCSHCGATDINGDKKIDQADLDMLQSHLDGNCQLSDCYFHGTRINREEDPDNPDGYIWFFIYTPTIAGTDNITFKPQSMTTTGTRSGEVKSIAVKAEEFKNPEIIKSWTSPNQDKYLINSTVELFAVTPLETDQVTFNTVQGTFIIKEPESIDYDKFEKTWKKTLVVNQAGIQNFTVTAQGEQSNNTYKSTTTPFKFTERIVDPKVTSTNRGVQTHSYSWTTSSTDAEGNVTTSSHTTYWYTITVTAVANTDTDFVVFNTPGGQVTATTYYQSGNNRNFSTSWTSYSSGESATATANATIGEKPVVKYNYMVTFDPQDGSNMAPVTVEYDKKISKPTDPVRYGFTFGGWYREARCINSWDFGSDTVRSTTVLYAKWTRNNYTMTFNSNGGSAMMPKSIPYDSTFNSPGEPSRTGYLFGGWYKDAGCTASWDFMSEKVQKDTTLYAKWIPIPYKVSFNSMGGNDIPSRSINYDSLISSPPTPTLTGYAFAGWYKDINLTQPWNMGSDRVKTATMLYAKWTVGKYDVTFNPQGGSAVTKATVNHNAVVPKPANPTRSGYTFGGWFKEAACTNPWRFDAFTVAGPMTLYAKWTADKSSLVFDSKGGSGVATKSGVTDGIITPTTLPSTTRSGYSFGGWYDNAAYNGSALTKLPDKYPVGTITYYARWHATAATFVFNTNGGSAVVDKTGVTDAAVTPTTLPTTTKAGFEFAGWYLTSDFSTSVLTRLPDKYPVGTTTIYARWVAQKAYIKFNSNGGNYVTKMIGNTDEIISPTTMPSIGRGGYTFAGWFNNSGLTGGTVTAKPNKYPAGTTEYWAKWTAKGSTIHFDAMGGNAVADKVGSTDQVINPTTMPTTTRSGYTFTGWYTQADYRTIKTTDLPAKYPVDGITYYAKWSANTATIEFNSNGGSSVTKMTGVTDRTIYNTALPTNLTKAGYTFDGWFDNAGLTGSKLTKLPDVYPAGSTTYYAKWAPKPAYFEFDAKGGDPVARIVGVTNGVVSPTTMPTATKSGYTLAGWYANADLSGAAVTALPGNYPIGTTRYYAKWTPAPAYLEFNTNGGSAVAKMTGTTEAVISNTTLPTSTRTGYTFAGWYDNAELSGTALSALPSKYPVGTNTYFAKWNPIPHTITFDAKGGSAVTGQTVNHDALITQPSAPAKSGYTFSGWYTDASYVTQWSFATDKVAGDMTLYAKWVMGLPDASVPLQDWSWAQINAVAELGKGQEYFDIGETKTDVVGGETLTFQIYDFNHDVLADGTSNKTNITFGLKDLMATKRSMNTAYTTVGGWNTFDTRTWMNGSLYGLLPGDLQPVIKDVNKYTAEGGGDTLATSVDKLFLFSEVEVSGVNTRSLAGEGFQYPIFSTIESRIKSRSGGTSTTWWLRSVYYASNYDGLMFNITGTCGNTTITGNSSINFGFALGKATTNTYTVSFDTQGGSAIAAQSATLNTVTSEPAMPTKSGMAFDGWYREAACTTKWDFANDRITENTTLFAKWKEEELPAIGTPLADCSWAQVVRVANAGLGDTYWNVGDTKDLTLSTNETVTMQIYGFDHDDKSDGSGTTNITFGTKGATTKNVINPSGGNTYGWDGSYIRGYLNGVSTQNAGTAFTTGSNSLISKFPSILKDEISSVKKYTSGGYNDQTIKTSSDKLFLFSEKETFGTNTNSLLGEGTQYPIFTDNTSRIKNNASGSSEYWWLRSPSLDGNQMFMGVNNVGDYDSFVANTSTGFAFGFALGTAPAMPAVGTPLSDCTWQQVINVANAGLGDTYWNVGDCKDLTLSTNETVTMQIYGFDHDEKSDGSGTTNITFGTKDLMNDKRQLNGTATNIGGWDTTALRSWANGTLKTQFPSILAGAVKPVKKYTSSGNSSGSTLITSTDSVFLFSEIEMFGRTDYSFAGEGVKYPIFVDDASRIKKMNNGTGGAMFYWSRSPHQGTTDSTIYINDFGKNSTASDNNSLGVAFGFALGNAPYTVTYDTQGGTAVPQTLAPQGQSSLITQPTPPTKAGCEFKGWYKESAGTNVWDFSTDKVSASTTLYAKWEVILPALGTPLSDCTWEQIAKVADQGLGDTYWNVGDAKDLTLSTSEVLTMQIYGFDHDAKADGSGTTNITFGTKHLMTDIKVMNAANIKTGGWDQTVLRTWMKDTLFGKLPIDLQNNVTLVSKPTSDGISPLIQNSSDKLFVFSEVELSGINTYSYAGEGYQYSIFTDNSSRIKKLKNGVGSLYRYWARSGSKAGSGFVAVETTGSLSGGYGAASTFGVAFGFCFGTAPAIPPIGTTLENCTWEQIKNIADAGMGDTYFNVGDTKNITANGETITMQIYGFDHDEKADGSGIANITFGSKGLLSAKKAMNPTNSNIGGWNGSNMRVWTNGALHDSFSSDLKNVITPVKKLTSGGYAAPSIVTSADKVFLFCEKEVFGTNIHTSAEEGTQYPIFTDSTSRTKYLPSSSSIVWWLRSAYCVGPNSFLGVNASGGNIINGADLNAGVAFGFAI